MTKVQKNDKKVIYYRNWDELPILLTMGQCAVLLNVSYECATKWAKSGKIPAKKISDKWRVEKHQLKAMFESEKQQNG